MTNLVKKYHVEIILITLFGTPPVIDHYYLDKEPTIDELEMMLNPYGLSKHTIKTNLESASLEVRPVWMIKTDHRLLKHINKEEEFKWHTILPLPPSEARKRNDIIAVREKASLVVHRFLVKNNDMVVRITQKETKSVPVKFDELKRMYPESLYIHYIESSLKEEK